MSIHQFTYDLKSSRLLDAGLRLFFWKSFECIVRFWLCVNVVWCDSAAILLFFRELTLNWAVSKSQIWNYIWSKVWTLMYWHDRDIILMRNWLVLDTICWISLDRRRNSPGHPLFGEERGDGRTEDMTERVRWVWSYNLWTLREGVKKKKKKR